MNIHFAQVREDPSVELSVINSLKSNSISVLMIGSGGCTLFSILGDHIKSVDVVDLNQTQLDLIMLKYEIITWYQDKEKIIDYFEGRLSKEEIKNVYDCVKDNLPPASKKFWDANEQLLYLGINNAGSYEQLFRELRESNFDYDKVFSKENLIKKFGKKAVDNCKDNFVEYFRKVITFLGDTYKPGENYFRDQIFDGKYMGSVPVYFNNVKQLGQYKKTINLINADLASKVLPNEKYDIVQISNILDWMSQDHIEPFLQRVYKSLKKGGFIITRKLLGNYNLKGKVSEYFRVVECVVDKSHLYSEVVVGKKV
jgi:S-adenosylmethionine-diacylglycerol 3-amino-3-carboxypropyl transferase